MKERENGRWHGRYGLWPGHGVFDAEKQREWEEWRDRRQLPAWCYDDETIGGHSLTFKLLAGVAAGLLLFVPMLWSEKWIGVIGAIGILYWMVRLFGWLLLPMIGGVFGFGVSAHRWWRGWMFGRRHS